VTAGEHGYEALTIERVRVGLYPPQAGVPLGEVTSFGNLLAGSAGYEAARASRRQYL